MAVDASAQTTVSERHAGPEWARWNRGVAPPYTIGVEEEVMLLHPADHSPAPAGEWVQTRLSDDLCGHTSLETHASVIELTTGIHTDVAGAVDELARLRARLASELGALGLAAAVAGTHPMARPGEARVSGTGRYGVIADTMRSLARRQPTFALHVHVGIPDPEDAIRVLNGLRSAVPLLLALSANSPFSEGRDSGFASARTMVFQAFPRTGTARRFSSYADYVGAVDALVASEAIPDPSFLWWDVRLQPALGTVEVRVMDAQSTITDSAALIALVQSLARLELGDAPTADLTGAEVLAENRFLAARDGLDARLIEPVTRRLVPVRALIEMLTARCLAHADPAGAVELRRATTPVLVNGADRQRAWAREGGVASLASTLAQQFSPSNDKEQSCVAGSPTRARPSY